MKNSKYAIGALAVILSAHAAYAAPEPDGPSYDELLKRVEQLEKLVQNERRENVARVERVEKKIESDGAPGSYGAPLLSFGGNKEAAHYVQVETAVTQPLFSRNSAYLFQDGAGAVSNVEFDFEYDVSPRIEFGYLAPTSELGWRARYWHYEVDASAPPHSPIDDAIVVGVGGTGIADLDAITSTNYDMEMDTFDLEFTQQISSGLISYGLRAQRNDQSYNLVDADEGTLNSQMETTLFGPTASIELSRPIPNTELSLYGNARLSALVGQRDLATTSPDGNSASDENMMALNGVLGAGVIWEPAKINEHLDGFYMNLGLEATYWSGMGVLMNNNTGPEDDLDDIVGGNAESDGDFANIGFILGVGWKW